MLSKGKVGNFLFLSRMIQFYKELYKEPLINRIIKQVNEVVKISRIKSTLFVPNCENQLYNYDYRNLIIFPGSFNPLHVGIYILLLKVTQICQKLL